MSDAFDELADDLSERPLFYLAIAGGILAWMIIVLGFFGLAIWIMRRRKLRKDQILERNYALLAERVGEHYPVLAIPIGSHSEGGYQFFQVHLIRRSSPQVVAGSSVAVPWILSLIIFIIIIALRVRKNRKYEKMASKTYGLSPGSDVSV